MSPEHHPEEQELRRWSRLALWTVIASTLAMTVWAAVAPLHSAVVSRGILRVEQHRQVVQHQEGGIVKAILVENGSKVRKGQALIELDDSRIFAGYDIVRQQYDAEQAKIARLQAEESFLDRPRYPAELEQRRDTPFIADTLRRENDLFQQRAKTLRLQISILNRQITEIDKEIAATRQQVEADDLAVKNMAAEVKLNKTLLDQGFVSSTRMLTLERSQADYQARLGEHRADLSRALQKQNELRLRIEELRNDYRQAAVAELKESSARMNELRQQVKPALDARQRQTVTSPMDGEVVNMQVHTVGAVIGPRETVMEVVPSDYDLIAEIRLPLDTISELKVGMAAEVRLLAFQYRSTPLVKGELIYLSADALSDPNGEPYYLGHIRLNQHDLEQARLGRLQPGMPAEAFIRTRSRNALSYLLDPIQQSLYRSFRER
jgi:HlyD family type I secretion membrane fusion protein